MSEDSRDKDLLAGEYALGLLEGDDRADAARLYERDADFAARVEFWNERFAHFLDGLAPVPAPAELKRRIEAEIFGAPSRRPPKAGFSFWQSLAVWRGLAAAGFAAAAVALAVLAVRPDQVEPLPEPADPAEPAAPLIATLQPGDAGPAVVALYDREDGVLTVRGAVPDDREEGDAQLWIIPAGEDTPRSLGVIDRDATRVVAVDDELRSVFAEGATLAISLEPEGGSPTGAPTGAIVLVGPVAQG